MRAAPAPSPIPTTRSAPAATPALAPIVLLHGWAMSARVWRAVQEALSAHPVHALALPGHDGTPAAANASLHAWSDALAEHIAPGSVLVGWSLGGMLALDIAQRYPSRVSRLVLIASTARFVADGEGWPGLATDTVSSFRQGFGSDPAATLSRFLALQCIGETPRKPVQRALTDSLSQEAAQALAAAQPVQTGTLGDGLGLLAESDLRPLLEHILQPCLLLHGDHDALMPLAAAEALASALPCARLHTLAGSGHALPVSRSAECAQHILAFITESGDA